MQTQLKTSFPSAQAAAAGRPARLSVQARAAAAPGKESLLRQLAPGRVAAKPNKAAPKPAAKPVPRKAATKVGTRATPSPKSNSNVRGIALFGAKADKGSLRPLQTGRASRLLSNIEQLRLLSQVEKAGLLSLAEKSGVTLSSIEKSGLLSKAEDLKLLSLISNPGTASALTVLGVLLLGAAPAVVYFTPDDTQALFAAQVAAASVLGSTGFGMLAGGALLGRLNK